MMNLEVYTHASPNSSNVNGLLNAKIRKTRPEFTFQPWFQPSFRGQHYQEATQCYAIRDHRPSTEMRHRV